MLIGITNSGEELKNIENNVKILCINNQSISAANGTFKWKKNKSKNGKIKLLLSYVKNKENQFTEILPIDVDLPIYRRLIVNISIDQNKINSNTNKDFYLLNQNKLYEYCDYKISVLGETNSGYLEDITSDAIIENSLNSPNINLSGTSISATNIIDDTPVVLTVSYRKYGNELTHNEYILFKSIEPENIIIDGQTIVEENSTVSYNINALICGRQDDVSDETEITLAAGNPDFISEIAGNTISFGSIVKAYENVTFIAKYKNISRFFTVTIKNI